ARTGWSGPVFCRALTVSGMGTSGRSWGWRRGARRPPDYPGSGEVVEAGPRHGRPVQQHGRAVRGGREDPPDGPEALRHAAGGEGREHRVLLAAVQHPGPRIRLQLARERGEVLDVRGERRAVQVEGDV